MIDVSAPIISYVSLGNIEIGSRIGDVLASAYTQSMNVEIQEFPNHPTPATVYSIDGGAITATCFNDGLVAALSCNEKYLGTYKDKFFPGMSVQAFLANSEDQTLMYGYLMADGDHGVAFEIPDALDYIDYVKDLPLDFRLKRVWVQKQSWASF